MANNDVVGAETAVANFQKQLPQVVFQCLGANPEVQASLQKYNVEGMSLDQIIAKLEAYALTHFVAVHQAATVANGNFVNGQYVTVGQEGGQIIQLVFGGSQEVSDDRNTLQLLYNGFYGNVGLPNPTTVLPCYDDASVTLTVNFIGTLLTDMANNDVVGAETAVTNFQKQLPQAVFQCLGANAEVQASLQKYNVEGLTLNQIIAKLEAYALTHFVAIHQAATVANGNFQNGQYVTVGQEGGQIIQLVFGNSQEVSDDRNTLQLLYNGFYGNVGLPNPTTVLACYDDASVTLTVNFIGTLLTDMANNDVVGAETAVTNFQKQLPQAVFQCLGSNAEVQASLQKYNVEGLTLNQIITKLEAYALTHFVAVHQAATVANGNFQNGQYVTVGQEGGQIIQLVFGNSQEVSDDRNTLQLLYNGFYGNVGLPNPTTVLACYDDASVTLTVNFIGTLLTDMANNDVVGAETAVTNFQKQLPQAVFQCLGANAEVQASLQKYNVEGLTLNQIIAKLEAYALTHFVAIHQAATVANGNFQNGQYVTVGQEGGQIIQLVFGNSKELTDSVANLQLMYNGFFEQSGLADPTTVLRCYDTNSAQMTIDFIQTLMTDIVNNDIVAAQAAISTFETQLPVPVQTCLQSNQEFQGALAKYGLTGQTLDQITTKLETYTVTHFLQMHKMAVIANQAFQNGDYVAVGKEGAVIAQAVYGGSSIITNLSDDPSTVIQQVFNGFWEGASLSDPTTPVTCFDQNSAQLTVTFMGNVLQQLANSDVTGAKTSVDNYVNQLPQPVKDCLGADAQVQQVLQAYHIAGTPAASVEADIVKFFIEHIFQLHKDAVTANNNFQNGKYSAVGQEGSVLAKEIFGSGNSSQDGPAEDTLQLYFNGFFEQANLTDPTTLISCFNEDTAQVTDDTIAGIVNSLATKNVIVAEKTIVEFVTQLPPSVKECVGQNEEFLDVVTAYNLNNYTLKEALLQVAKSVLGDAGQLNDLLTTANEDITNENYTLAGTAIGQAFEIMFVPSTVSDDDSVQDLQSVFNGFWEQGGLADPTTVAACFDDQSAQVTLDTLGQIISALASNQYTNIPSILKQWQSQIPQSVLDCFVGNPEVTQVGQAYGIVNANPEVLVGDVAKYVLGHFQQFHESSTEMNQEFQAAQYTQVGSGLGQVIQEIVA